jgi:hypothetical protein
MRYSGVAQNRAGDTVETTFRIYATPQGGEAIWSETQQVTVGADGKFSVLLGAATENGLPDAVFQGGQGRWLGVSIERAPEAGRSVLATVAYAMKAADAESLAGRSAADFVTQEQLSSQLANATQALVQPALVHPDVTPTGSGAANNIAMWTSASNIGESGLTELGSTAAPLLGVGTATPATTLDVKGTTTLRGNATLPAASVATAAGGVASPKMEWAASSFKSGSTAQTETFALQAIAEGNNTIAPSASLYLFYGASGASPTSTGLYFSPTGKIGFVAGQTFPGTGTITGVTATSPLTGGGTTGAVTLGLNTAALETTLNSAYAQLGSFNEFTQNQQMDAGLTVDQSVTANSMYSNVGYSVGDSIIATGNVGLESASLGFSFSPSEVGGFDLGVGYQALLSDTTGQQNTAVGVGALTADQDGSDNTALGYDALSGTIGGCAPNPPPPPQFRPGQATLADSLLPGVKGKKIHSNGTCANPIGVQNTGVGVSAGQFNTAGVAVTALGFNAGPDAASTGLVGATAVGANSTVSENYAVVLGQTTTSPGAINANVGIGTATPVSALELNVHNEGELGPTITLTNPSGAGGATDAIDFYTTIPNPGSIFSPPNAGAEIRAEDNDFSDNISFYSNIPGAKNNGFRRNMTVYAGGGAQIVGNLNVTGTLSKGGGSFKIDHPLDPANKYLSHSFVESPDMMNIYNGRVILDANGAATVEMPEWFEALNRDFEYQLTAIGAAAPGLYVAKEIDGNHFSIAGGKPGMKVSWQVTGVRQDAWANAHRIPVEEDKPANERGYYLHPDLYGAGPDKQVGNAPKEK